MGLFLICENGVTMQHIVRTSLIVLFTILIAGCESLATDSTQEKDDPFSPRLRASELLSVEEVEITAESVVENKALVKTGPGTDFDGQVIDILSDRLGDDLVGEKLVVSFNNMPIPAFVNEVFSEQLGLSFTLDPAVKKLTDLVTLRILDPVTPRDLFQIAQRTLAAYGIGIERQQNLYVFSLNANVARNDSPLLVTGEALPEVPESHRPYFVFRTLKIVSNNKITSWLNSALQGAEVRITQVPDGNSLLLQGKYSAVKKAMALIEALDHPLLRGKQSRIVFKCDLPR